jgi:hypothetical protein
MSIFLLDQESKNKILQDYDMHQLSTSSAKLTKMVKPNLQTMNSMMGNTSKVIIKVSTVSSKFPKENT